MAMKSEALLVSRAALLGDKAAFGRLVECYQSPVRRFLFNLTGGNEELSKDLAQETFVKAWLKIGSFRAAARFTTWLYRIAYNTFYDHMRSSVSEYGVDIGHAGKNIAVANAGSDINMDVASALAVLSVDERTAVLLFYMEDRSVDDISRIINSPAGTVKSHLSRSRRKHSDYSSNSDYREQN